MNYLHFFILIVFFNCFSARAKCEEQNKRNGISSLESCLLILIISDNSEDKGSARWESLRAFNVNDCVSSYIKDQDCKGKSDILP